VADVKGGAPVDVGTARAEFACAASTRLVLKPADPNAHRALDARRSR